MNAVSYPRTPHLPFSVGATRDDRILTSDGHFHGKEIIVTIKKDGENTTIYNDQVHARSVDSRAQAYHSWLLNFASQFQYKLTDQERICGEYLYAQHSIPYESLNSFFLGFSFWLGDTCMSWEDTMLEFDTLGIESVPVVWHGTYDPHSVLKVAETCAQIGEEGIVIRLADSFKYQDFGTSVAKYVRKDHVQSDEHWTKKEIVPNKLRK